MSGIVGNAVSDRMKYGVKQAAVRSENALRNIKASNGTTFTQNLGTEIVFELPSNANGTYCDFSKSYFRFSFITQFGKTGAAAAENLANILFERGAESMFRRVQFYDASGTLLESFEHYNEIFAVMNLLTGNSVANNTIQNAWHEGYCSNTGLNYPDLGSAVLSVQGTAASTSEAFLNQSAFAVAESGDVTKNYDVVFQLSSALFGGSALKYLRKYILFVCITHLNYCLKNIFCMKLIFAFLLFSVLTTAFTAVNGLRMVLTLDTHTNTFVTTNANVTVKSNTITDPTFFYTVIRVDPMVDASLIEAARGKDGLIRIHSQRWAHFSHTVPANATTDEYVIPIRVSSLKALYFGFQRNDATNSATTKSVSLVENVNSISNSDLTSMKSAFVHNGITEYQFFIDGSPTPATPVRVGTTVSGHGTYLAKIDQNIGMGECTAELARACHVMHKTMDAAHMTLLHAGTDKMLGRVSRNMLFGVELESMSNKSNVIERYVYILFIYFLCMQIIFLQKVYFSVKLIIFSFLFLP